MNWYDILHIPCLWITSLYVIFIPILVYNHACPLALSSPQFSLPIHFMHILKIKTHIYHTYLFNKPFIGASLVSQRLKRLPVMQKTWVWSLGREDPLEKEMATHSSILAWEIPWTEEPGGLQSTGSQKSLTRLSNFPFTFIFTYTPDIEQLETYCDWHHSCCNESIPYSPAAPLPWTPTAF